VLLGCQQALALEDIPSVGVGSAEEALKRIGENFAGIVISDIRPAGYRRPGTAHPPQGPG